jgi:GT2 family glycosyltransferase
MKKIGVVIVTCGEHKPLYRHLELLKGQLPDSIFIINTGPVPVKAPKLSCSVIIRKIDDVGPAGGFNEGAKIAIKTCDYVVFADDDAYPCQGIMKVLRRHAEKGTDALAGNYTEGIPINLANHYFMVKKEVLLKVGFHYAPFFMMFEDEEFYKRVDDQYPVTHDARLIIDHSIPFFIVEKRRAHMYFRNGLFFYSMRNNLLGFIKFFTSTFYQALYFVFFLGTLEMLKVHFAAFLDFLCGRMGKVATEKKCLLPVNAEPDDDSILVTHKPVKSKYEVFCRKLPSFPILDIKTYLDYVRKTALKDVIVTGQLMAAYMPYPLFAKRIFIRNKKTSFFHRPNTLLSLVLVLVFLLVPAPQIAFVLFFLRYKRTIPL